MTLLSLCRGGQFVFTFVIPPVYPHEPPKVKCRTKARAVPHAEANTTHTAMGVWCGCARSVTSF